MNYDYPFINQYIEIPYSVSRKVNSMFKTEKRAVKYCIKLIIVNLLAKGTIAYSKSGRFYQKHHTQFYRKKPFLDAVNLVEKAELTSIERGSKDIRFEQGFSSRLRPSNKLFREFKTVKEKTEVSALPFLEVDDIPIFNINKLNNKKYSNYKPIQTMPIPMPISINNTNPTPLSQPLRHYFEISYCLNNEYFNKIKIDISKLDLKKSYMEDVGLTRIFKNGECGRWYQSGGFSYQQLPKEERVKILINGLEVTELDYSALHPNLLFCTKGQQAPANIYQSVVETLKCSGYPEVTKNEVKSVILMSINAKSHPSLISAINENKREEVSANIKRKAEGRQEREILYDNLKKLKLKPITIVNTFTSIYPILSEFVYSALANKLMLAESEIMTSSLLELKKLKIPSLPIHDSLLFPKQHAEAVKKVMLDCYKQYTGFDIQVK